MLLVRPRETKTKNADPVLFSSLPLVRRGGSRLLLTAVLSLLLSFGITSPQASVAQFWDQLFCCLPYCASTNRGSLIE